MIKNAISFLAYPVISLVYRVEVLLFILLSGVFLSQTNLPLRETFSIVKWVLLIAFVILEYLLIRFISLDIPKSKKLPPFVYLLGAYIVYLVLTSPWSISFETSLSKVISLSLLVLLSFFIIPYYSEELNRKTNLINAIYYFFVLGILYNTFNLIGGPSQISSLGAYVRYGGVFEHSNMLGLFCFSAQPVLFYKYMTSVSRGEKVINLLLIGLSMILALMSFARASLLGILIFIISFSYFYNRKLFALSVVVSLITATVVMSSPLLLELLRLAEDPLTLRDKLWDIAIDAWKENKIFGLGYGTTTLVTASRFVMYQKGFWSHQLGSRFHNIYIEVLCETGLIGLGLFLLILFSLARETVYSIQSSVGKERILGVCYLSLFFAVMIYSFFESFTLSAGNTSSIVFWLLAGLAVQKTRS